MVLLMACYSKPCLSIMGVGNLMAESGQYQKNNKGERQIVELAPYVSFHHGFKIPKLPSVEFIPEIAFAFHRAPSPNHSRMTWMLLYPLSWNFNRGNHLRAGLGNFITRIAGKGGTALMNNGNDLVEFDNPKVVQYSPLAAAFLGYEYRFKNKLGLRFDYASVPLLANPFKRFAILFSANVYGF